MVCYSVSTGLYTQTFLQNVEPTRIKQSKNTATNYGLPGREDAGFTVIRNAYKYLATFSHRIIFAFSFIDTSKDLQSLLLTWHTLRWQVFEY